MKIVQTYFNLNTSHVYDATDGWLSAEFNWMSWALSCLQLKQLYGEVELYCNEKGKEVLVNMLELPYSGAYIHYERDYPKELWAYSKLQTYSLQQQPFIHFDGDIFMWSTLDDTLVNSPLIAQNLEYDTGYYRKIINDEIDQLNFWTPEVIRSQQQEDKNIRSYNMGITGGSDIDFYKEYTSLAFNTIENNTAKLRQLSNLTGFNVYFEQQLFYCLSKRRNIPVACYLREEIENHSYMLSDFAGVPYQTQFLHVLGGGKRAPETCLMLAKRLRKDYPYYYNRILDLCKRLNIVTYLNCNTPHKRSLLPPYLRTIDLLQKQNITIREPEYSTVHASIQSIENKKMQPVLHELFQIEHRIQNKMAEPGNPNTTELEERNYANLEIVFKDSASLYHARFLPNPHVELIPVSYDFESPEPALEESNSSFALLFNSLTATFDPVFCDELNTWLVALIAGVHHFESIIDEAARLFPETEITENYADFVELITLKLKFLVIKNIILCEAS